MTTGRRVRSVTRRPTLVFEFSFSIGIVVVSCFSPICPAIETALKWLTCTDQSKIRQGEGATLQSVKKITNKLLDDPDLDLQTVRIGSVHGQKTMFSAEQLREKWASERIRAVLLDSPNEDSRREFLNAVQEVRAEQNERQEKRTLATEAKREEKKRVAALERAELQAQRDRLHKLLKSNRVYLLAICPVVRHGFRNWEIFSAPTTDDKQTRIVEAKLKDRSCIGNRFRGAQSDYRKYDFVFDSINITHIDSFGSSYVSCLFFFFCCLMYVC